MPRLLIYETMVHHIDTARYLFGPIESVYAQIRRHNPVIQGEDCALVTLRHTDSVDGIIDGHRFVETVPQGVAMGEAWIDGDESALWINGRGEIFKSGGRVMKNVTGYDLCRGLAGSWGTLAVLTEVTFKVLPTPDETGTLILFGLPDEIAVEVLCTAMASPYEVSAAVHLQPALAARLEHSGLRSQGKAVTALRIENFAKSVAYRKGRLKDLLKAYGTIMDLERGATHQLWNELRRLSVLRGGDGPIWRISTEPTAGPKVVAAISSFMDCRAFYDWSGGLVWAEVLPTTDAGAADVRRVIAAHGGHATLIRAEPDVRAAVEVFQPLEAGLDRLSRRLKAAFDPAGILNPGRMYAGV